MTDHVRETDDPELAHVMKNPDSLGNEKVSTESEGLESGIELSQVPNDCGCVEIS